MRDRSRARDKMCISVRGLCGRAFDHLGGRLVFFMSKRRSETTHFTGPPQRLLRLLLHTTLTAEFMCDPFLQQMFFDLAVGETVCEVTDEAKGEFYDRVGSLLVC